MKDSGIAAEIEASRRHIIERPRLTRLLDEADARILMLVAPAGYGKTTLARQWVTAGGRSCYWLVATPAVTDAASFALHLRDTLQPHEPEIGRQLEQLLRAGRRSRYDAETLGDYLADSVQSWDDNSWLVVDDYHHLAGTDDVESLLDSFLKKSRIRCLITSRLRPDWATARRLLYGEIHELGRSALAMTHDEAFAVLKQRGRDERAGLIALADGWPAIIGLAAEADVSAFRDAVVPGSLYEFFAEELFQAASPNVREGLVTLALVPTLTAPICGVVLGARCGDVLRDGVRLGLVQESATDEYSMHSLVREFLLGHRDEVVPSWRLLVGQLALTLLGTQRPDDLFLLASTFPDVDDVRKATDNMIGSVLEENRIERLDGWVELAHRMHLDTAVIDLADAEIAFREGRYNRAEVLAQRSAERSENSSPLKARAWCRAGLSAYHENRAEQALLHHERAIATATRDEEKLQAVWGSLAATLELERDAEPFVSELEKASISNPLSRVRLANARLSHSYRTGGLSDAIEDAEAVRPLLERVDDPMVTSAFLNSLSAALSLAGRYDRSLAVAEEELQVIDQYRLMFATPHGLLCRAAAYMGRRSFADARHDLRLAEKAARAADDSFSLGNTAAMHVKLLLAQGDARSASELSFATDLPDVPDSLKAEFLALRLLSLAATNTPDEIDDLMHEAVSLTRYVETHELVSWADVARKANANDDDAPDAALASLQAAAASDVWHPFVIAYRAAPKILPLLATDAWANTVVRGVVGQARDATIARSAGFTLPKQAARDLSPRETEVLALLAEGLSNKEIGERLFISQVTAKVHVRRIFEKLGVRSRTEAALLAVRYLEGERNE